VLANVAAWLAPKLLEDAITQALQNYKFDVGKEIDDFKARATTALNGTLGADVAISTNLGPITIAGPFTENSSFEFTADMSGTAKLDVVPSGETLPSGREIRYVSVYFETFRDDKDAEEPLDLWIYQAGNPNAIAHREIGRDERWGDSPAENQGPYFLRIPNAFNISDCHTITLRIRKQPAGSATGKGWWNRMQAKTYRASGSIVVAGHSPDSQWGDGDDHPYDRTFSFCDSGH
jgi:hypothetical protein